MYLKRTYFEEERRKYNFYRMLLCTTPFLFGIPLTKAFISQAYVLWFFILMTVSILIYITANAIMYHLTEIVALEKGIYFKAPRWHIDLIMFIILSIWFIYLSIVFVINVLIQQVNFTYSFLLSTGMLYLMTYVFFIIHSFVRRGCLYNDGFNPYVKWKVFTETIKREKLVELSITIMTVLISATIVSLKLFTEQSAFIVEIFVSMYIGSIFTFYSTVYSILAKLDDYAEEISISSLARIIKDMKRHYIVVGYGPLQKRILENLVLILQTREKEMRKEDPLNMETIILPTYEMVHVTRRILIITSRELEIPFTFVTPTGEHLGLAPLPRIYSRTVRLINEYIPVIIGNISDEEVQERANMKLANVVIATQRDVKIIDRLFRLGTEIGLEDKLWILRGISTPRYSSMLIDSLYLNMYPFHLASVVGFNVGGKVVQMVKYITENNNSKDFRILIIGLEEQDSREIYYVIDLILSEFENLVVKIDKNTMVAPNVLICGPLKYYYRTYKPIEYVRNILKTKSLSTNAKKKIQHVLKLTAAQMEFKFQFWIAYIKKLTQGEKACLIPWIDCELTYPTMRELLEKYEPDIIVLISRNSEKMPDAFCDIVHALFKRELDLRNSKQNHQLPILLCVIPEKTRVIPTALISYSSVLSKSFGSFAPCEIFHEFYEPVVHLLSGIFSSYILYDASFRLLKEKKLERIFGKYIIPRGYLGIGLKLRDVPLASISLLAVFGGLNLTLTDELLSKKLPNIRFNFARIIRGHPGLARYEFICEILECKDYIRILKEIFNKESERMKFFCRKITVLEHIYELAKESPIDYFIPSGLEDGKEPLYSLKLEPIILDERKRIHIPPDILDIKMIGSGEDALQENFAHIRFLKDVNESIRERILKSLDSIEKVSDAKVYIFLAEYPGSLCLALADFLGIEVDDKLKSIYHEPKKNRKEEIHILDIDAIIGMETYKVTSKPLLKFPESYDELHGTIWEIKLGSDELSTKKAIYDFLKKFVYNIFEKTFPSRSIDHIVKLLNLPSPLDEIPFRCDLPAIKAVVIRPLSNPSEVKEFVNDLHQRLNKKIEKINNMLKKICKLKKDDPLGFYVCEEFTNKGNASEYILLYDPLANREEQLNEITPSAALALCSDAIGDILTALIPRILVPPSVLVLLAKMKKRGILKRYQSRELEDTTTEGINSLYQTVIDIAKYAQFFARRIFLYIPVQRIYKENGRIMLEFDEEMKELFDGQKNVNIKDADEKLWSVLFETFFKNLKDHENTFLKILRNKIKIAFIEVLSLSEYAKKYGYKSCKYVNDYLVVRISWKDKDDIGEMYFKIHDAETLEKFKKELKESLEFHRICLDENYDWWPRLELGLELTNDVQPVTAKEVKKSIEKLTTNVAREFIEKLSDEDAKIIAYNARALRALLMMPIDIREIPGFIRTKEQTWLSIVTI